MKKKKYPREFLKLLKSVKAKRPKTVIDHILRHGRVTTEEIKEKYGYNHPPRAIRDVREQGIPVITFSVIGTDGRRIAAYKFGDPKEVRATQLSGRTAFTARLKSALVKKCGARCNIYLNPFPAAELQIDHRVPFEIAGGGSASDDDADEYMLLCASANRAKSWSCENCANWSQKKISVCRSCYWAYPESYTHVAMHDIRRVDILWAGKEVVEYEMLAKKARKMQKEIPEYVKDVLRRHFGNKEP